MTTPLDGEKTGMAELVTKTGQGLQLTEAFPVKQPICDDWGQKIVRTSQTAAATCNKVADIAAVNSKNDFAQLASAQAAADKPDEPVNVELQDAGTLAGAQDNLTKF